MIEQHFVYAEFVTPADASRAVSALVDRSFDPDQIDVLSVHDTHVERVPIQHHRPVLAGAMFGVLCGLVIGLSIGIVTTYGSQIDAWAGTTRFMLLGAACGFLTGALGGLVWWRSGVQLKAERIDSRFVVGTIVGENRSQEVAGILQEVCPCTTGDYPVTGEDIARQHAERIVVTTP